MNIIELRNVSKIYKMGKTTLNALSDISVNIKSGDFIAIIGKSGSGKSTLMNILGCLDVPTSGEYYLCGENVGRMAENHLSDIRSRKIGFIFQNFNLISTMSAYENVELPLIYRGVNPVMRKNIVTKALKSVGLSSRLDHKPSELSGGQQQRVAIARALALSPQIILADEPTGNLDTGSGEDVMNLLSELNEQGKTVILITHDNGVANKAKTKIEISDGKIIC